MRFDAPSRLWVAAPAVPIGYLRGQNISVEAPPSCPSNLATGAVKQPFLIANSYPPANPWFPRGANGTGQDFRGVDIAWRVL